tara:strand:+ start:2101 stop:3681 length:1581 start_codon:yes stop_codon:yes gene_type:complete
MPTDDLNIRHSFGGGWATDFGPVTDAAPDPNGLISIPFLIDAENVFFDLDGGPRKIPGQTALNGSAMAGGAEVLGIFDYWDTGTGTTSQQHRIAHAGGFVFKDDADGSFSSIFTVTAGAVPAYAVLEDLLVIADDSNNAPNSWDGTTAQALAGSPPNFAFVVEHQNRLWAAGVAANSSRLYYSASLDPADWTGSGSGSIDISPRDGDRITGLISHNNELLIFKGPYKGSIHRITGSAPTGDDTFARKTLVIGVGSAGHNCIFRFRNDVGFVWSDGTVRSISGTERYGDFAEAALSRPINQNFMGSRVSQNALNKCWAANDDANGRVLITMPVDGSNVPNAVLAYDYRFEPGRWSYVPNITARCLASVVDQTSNNRRIVMTGGTDGVIYKWSNPTRTNGGAISSVVTTPGFSYGVPIVMKTIVQGGIGISPFNDGNITLNVRRDNNTIQTFTIASSGFDVLGSASANQFTLGTSQLGGDMNIDIYDDNVTGEFHSVSYQVTHGTDSEDFGLNNISAAIQGGSWSTEL